MIITRRWIKAFVYVVLLGMSIFSCAPPRYSLKSVHTSQTSQYSNADDSVQVEEYNWDNTSDEHYIYSEKTLPIKQKQSYNVYKQKKSDAHRSIKYETPKNIKSQYAKVSFKRKKIPRQTYRVKRGDTLYRIARKYNVSVKDICQKNHIKDVRKIYVGMVLHLPFARTRSVAGSPQQKQNKQHSSSRSKKEGVATHLVFKWPVQYIRKVKRDGRDGVKSIGIVITGSPGSYVLPAAPGKVQKIGYMRGFGNYIVIAHQNRFMTVYANLEKILVHEGVRILARESIGRLKHNSPILHFQINKAGKPQNPLVLLPKRQKSS